MADAQASGACGRKIVWVQVPSPALFYVQNEVLSGLMEGAETFVVKNDIEVSAPLSL